VALNFDEHIQTLRAKCFSRLNIIKTLMAKEWSLNSNTLCQIYKSLVRSIIDYSSIISTRLSNVRMASINAIQNKCLRIIHKLSYDCPSELIYQTVDMPKISERCDTLNMNYLISCIHNENDLVKDLILEYKSFKSRPIKYISLLGKYYDAVKQEVEPFTDIFD